MLVQVPNPLPKPSTHELTLVFAPSHDIVSKEAIKLFILFVADTFFI